MNPDSHGRYYFKRVQFVDGPLHHEILTVPWAMDTLEWATPATDTQPMRNCTYWIRHTHTGFAGFYMDDAAMIDAEAAG